MKIETKETQIIWTAAGKPTPCDTRGIGLTKAKGARDRCARCGDLNGVYSHDQIVSTNFIPTRNANRLRTFGTIRYCAACVFCSKTLRLRCISWFATVGGIAFWRTRPDGPDGARPDALAALLNPPAPPFVCGVPLYGIGRGGEAHWKRTWWPGEAIPEVPLVRLQSKHVALYSRTALSRDRYPVQVDDQADFVLERDVWLRARDAASSIVAATMSDGVKPYPAKLTLCRLELPNRASVALSVSWRRLTAPLRPLIHAHWWPIFCELFPNPGVKSCNDLKKR